jgi:hypothetical protein
MAEAVSETYYVPSGVPGAGGRFVGPIFSQWYERSSFKPAGSSIVGVADDAVVTIQPSGEFEQWLEFGHQIELAAGKRPSFRVAPHTGNLAQGGTVGPWNSYSPSRKPHFCYPLVNPRLWYPFSTCTINTTDNRLEFRHSSAFEHDVVRIGRGRQWSVHNAGSWLAGLASTYPMIVQPAPSAAAFSLPSGDITDYAARNFAANTFSAHTGPYGQSIGKTPFYAALIDDPVYGGSKRVITIVGGVHAGEDYGDFPMMAGIEYLLGGSSAALYLRERFKFLLYPMLNPTGRAAGCARTSYITRSGVHDDPNRRWNIVPANNETLDKPRTAIEYDLAALANVTVHVDYHGTYLGSRWGMTIDAAEPNDGVFASKVHDITGFTIDDDSNTPVDALGGYMMARGAKMAVSLEMGDPTPNSDADTNKYGVAVFQALAEMDQENYFA